ncbi:MAG: hypothetical protein M0Z42_05935 [Actinomycetota bacterium]|nr:hypothetical protein [Actinomycetota bacterium]
MACVWAEWYRHLAEAAIPPASALPRDLWWHQITDLQVADLSDATEGFGFFERIFYLSMTAWLVTVAALLAST